MARFAFLLGIVVVPGVLVWLGHRMRDRSPRQRRVFWGAVIGHSVALIIALVALHYPPVMWDDGPRVVLALWSLLLGAGVGALAGALRR
jgi:hypothetical protein